MFNRGKRIFNMQGKVTDYTLVHYVARKVQASTLK